MELNSDPSVGLSFYPAQPQPQLMNQRGSASRKITMDQQQSPPSKQQNRTNIAPKSKTKPLGRNERPQTAKVRPSGSGPATLQNTTYKAYQVKQQPKKSTGAKNPKTKKPLKDLASVSSAAKLQTEKDRASRQQQQLKDRQRSSHSANRSQSHSRARSASYEPADQIRKRVYMQYQNYMSERVGNETPSIIAEEDIVPSEKPREVKKAILEEQQEIRRREEAAKRNIEIAEAKRKQDALNALNLRFKSQTATFKKQQEAERRQKSRDEKSSERARKADFNGPQSFPIFSGSGSNGTHLSMPLNNDPSSAADYASGSALNARGFSSKNVAHQMTDLRSWIEDAIQREQMGSTQQTPEVDDNRGSAQNIHIEGVELGGNNNQPTISLEVPQNSTKSGKGAKKAKSKSREKSQDAADKSSKRKKSRDNSLSNNVSHKVEELVGDKDTDKLRMLKHQLPGNSLLSEKEASKLGGRKNRYGVFGPEIVGNEAFIENDYDRVVEIQNRKMRANEEESRNEEDPLHGFLNSNEKAKAKQNLVEALKELNTRADIEFEIKKSPKKSSMSKNNELSNQQSPASDGSSDKIPVKLSSTNSSVSKYRQKVNKPVEETKPEKSKQQIPGILNTQSHVEKLAAEKHERETKAAIQIQKRVRGFWGRQEAQRKRRYRARHIEDEYENLNRELKAGNSYNLKSYLREKKAIREQIGLEDSIKSESIAEQIGESQSLGGGSRKASGMSAQLQSLLFGSKSRVNKTTGHSAPDKDPLSLISIYAKRNGGVPEDRSSQRLRKDRLTTSSSRDERRRKRSKNNEKLKDSSTLIEEDYEDDFEESIPKSDSISDELANRKQTSSSGSHSKMRAKSGSTSRKSKNPKRTEPIVDENIVDEVIEESIPEDSQQLTDSIVEESIVKNSQSQSIVEDSIIREEYDNVASNTSKGIQARQKQRFGLLGVRNPAEIAKESNLSKGMQEIANKFGQKSSSGVDKAEMEKKSGDLLKLVEEREFNDMKRSRIVSDLLHEMKEYEAATMSTVMVERMEKILTTSLAQKDQIIMAQRLAELEAEKRHQEEINRIREEQIKLMSQLMLLGGVQQSNVGTPQTDAQREEILKSIKALVEKPIEIKNETVHVNYSIQRPQNHQVPQVDVLGSDKFSASISGNYGRPKKSYLQEYDESRASMSGADFARQTGASGVGAISGKQIVDMVEEDFALRSGGSRLGGSFSRQERKNSHSNSIDDLVGDVASAIEESIKEDISEISVSGRRASARKTNFDDFKAQGYKEASAGQDTAQMRKFLDQVEIQIGQEKGAREEKLARDLKRRQISPRTYDRNLKEVDRWAAAEKKSLASRRSQLNENVRQLSQNRGAKSAPSVNPLGSIDDSKVSEDVKDALRQAQMLDQGLTGLSADQRYLQKKRDAALKLLEEKEKAIKKGLQNKLEKFQENVAEDLLHKALELDIDDEINKRFEQMKRKIDESAGLRNEESNRSNLSTSYTGVPHTQATTDRSTSKMKKSVKFDSSVGQLNRLTSQSRVELEEDSIQESIQIAESISQMSRSQSAADKYHSRSGSLPAPRNMAENSYAESEDQYSEDFNESAASGRDTDSKSLAKSKQRLQQKVKDLEESNAYSENFEEESLAKSQSANLSYPAAPGPDGRNMATVKEESIDESIEVGTASRQGRSNSASHEKDFAVDQQADSLPSEDIEIKDSARSVDWKIDLQQETRATTAPGKSTVMTDEQEIEEEDEGYSDDDFEQSHQPSSHQHESGKFIEEVEALKEAKNEAEEESSDLNTRDQLDQFGGEEESESQIDQSYPSENFANAGRQSASGLSESADLEAQADLITEELMSEILREYQQDEREEDLELSNLRHEPSEEDFKDKFPWTLDKVEIKMSPKPAGIVQPGTPTKKEKTAREIEDEKFLKQHEEKAKVFSERQKKANEFLDFLCERIDIKNLQESLNKPITRDPLKILTQIQGYDEEESLNAAQEESLLHAQQQILPQSYFNKMDREFVIIQRMKQIDLTRSAAENSDVLTVSQEDRENIQNVHHYALFEALNEALDSERLYQTKGEPMPWSKDSRMVRYCSSEEQAAQILEKAKKTVQKWSEMRSGSNFAPLPEAPPQTQDEMGEEIVPPPLADGEEERKNLFRQEKLAELMTQDIVENDKLWVDYEIQDTQTRFDVADMILHQLAGEITEFLGNKQKVLK